MKKTKSTTPITAAAAMALAANAPVSTTKAETIKAPEAKAEPEVKNEAGAETIQATATTTTATTVIVAAPSKASIANNLLAGMFAKPEGERMARKDMIAALVKDAKLTPAGAATYLQNFKHKHGLTKPRTAATA